MAASPRPPAGPQRHRNLVPSRCPKSICPRITGMLPSFLGSAKQAWTVRDLRSTKNRGASGKTLASKNGRSPTFRAYTRAVLIVTSAPVRADDPLP